MLGALQKRDAWSDGNSSAVAALRETIGMLTSDEIKEALRFVVGRSTINEEERIHVGAVEGGRMPESSMCYNELQWPVDATKERLLLAMRNASISGFQTE